MTGTLPHRNSNSASHASAWDHLSTHVLELFLLFSTKRDPKTKGKDIGQGLALSWGKKPSGSLTILRVIFS